MQNSNYFASPTDRRAPLRPPRSKGGCLTCRRRKVRCNEQKPICSHCERLNLECKWRPSSTDLLSRQTVTMEMDFSSNGDGDGSRQLSTPFLIQSSITDLDESFNSLFNYASFMWEGADIWTKQSPGGMNQDSSDINHTAQSKVAENSSSFLPNNGVMIQVSQDMAMEGHSFAISNPDMGYVTSATKQSAHGREVPAEEGLLSEYFTQTVVPPILAQVETEQKWSSMRQILISMSNSSSMVRSAVLAFSDLMLCRQAGHWVKNTQKHYGKAAAELESYRDSSSLANIEGLPREHLLATLFFLSYIDLLEGRVNRAHANLKKAHEIFQEADKTKFRMVEIRFLSWIRLLDARAVSAGGDGLFLSHDDESLLAHASPCSNGGNTMSDDEESLGTEIEEVLFNLLYEPGLVFFQKNQSFMGRISKIDPWHRSRGTVEDETEVMNIAANITRDLESLYDNRPLLMDYAVAGVLTSAHVSANIAFTITRAFRTYLSNHLASKIHLHRVAYKSLQLAPETLSAISRIRHLAQLMVDGPDGQEMLPVNMLWPLLMWGAEEDRLEERKWIKAQILNMEKVATNATITAQVLEEVQSRQDATKQRVDVRKVMHDIFDSCFAIV